LDVAAPEIHPSARAPRFSRPLPRATQALGGIAPPAALAHPFDDGPAVIIRRSIDSTATGLGADASAYRSLMEPLVANWLKLEQSVLGPLRWPRHPLALARFGIRALQPASRRARRLFSG